MQTDSTSSEYSGNAVWLFSYTGTLYNGQSVRFEKPKIRRYHKIPHLYDNIVLDQMILKHDKYVNNNRNKMIELDKRWKTKKGLWRYKLKK